ncbi:MAG: membrane protein insertase YidC [Acidobacteriota bacterium]
MSQEKRALLATVLSMAVLLTWYVFLSPPQPPSGQVDPGALQQEPWAVAETAQIPALQEAQVGTQADPSAAVEAGEERIFILENEFSRVKITNAGARVISWRLLEYTGAEGYPLELVPPHQDRPELLPLDLVVPGDGARTKRLNEVLYVCSESEYGPRGIEITCRWADGHSEAVEKTLALPESGYLASVRISAAPAAGPMPLLVWAPGLTKGEHRTRSRMSAGLRLALSQGRKVKRVNAEDAGSMWRAPEEVAAWAGVEEDYFAAVFIPDEAPARFALYGLDRNDEHPQEVGVGWQPGGSGSALLFVGPKSYDLLGSIDRELNLGLQRLIDYGFFEVIVVGLFWALKKLHGFTGSYGMAIIALTILIKLAFYPITQRSMVSMRKMQKQMKRLQPRIQHLKDQYARKQKSIENRQKLNQEMMALYKRENVNPMAGLTGCLPMLLQIPILWGFYNLLSVAIELRRAPFLYLDDLSARDPYFITPIVMGLTMFIQQRMTGMATPDPAQRWLLNIMPLMMTFLFINFPSGLVLYWLVSNLLGIGQQYLINRKADAAEVAPARGRAAMKRA